MLYCESSPSNKLYCVLMPRLTVLLLLVVALISACQPEATETSTHIAPAATPITTASNSELIEFTHGGVTIRMPKPAGWESFPTDSGVVVAEKFGSVADQGSLHGLMSYVFVNPLSDFPEANPADGNQAQAILNQIISDPSYIGVAKVSATHALNWQDYDSAYYLLSDPQANLRTLVIGVAVPEQGVVVICTLSAPAAHESNVRQHLTSVLGGLMINHTTISPEALAMLPDPLVFPTD